MINLELCNSLAIHPELNAVFTLTGVLRHELGHILGFRHEHTRDQAQAPHCFEDSNFRPATEYDAASVMHYPHCNGEGNWSFELTQLDKRGAAFFYPDFSKFSAARCEVEIRTGAVNEECLPVVHQLLELANTASFDVLDNWVKLDVRAVEAIVGLREISPLNTMQKLREIPILEDVGLMKMYDYLYIDGRCPLELDPLTGLIDPPCMPVANRVLELVNTASFETLDEEVPLDIRAAANLVAIREHRPFTALSELWEVSYVKTKALQAMYFYTLPDQM